MQSKNISHNYSPQEEIHDMQGGTRYKGWLVGSAVYITIKDPTPPPPPPHLPPNKKYLWMIFTINFVVRISLGCSPGIFTVAAQCWNSLVCQGCLAATLDFNNSGSAASQMCFSVTLSALPNLPLINRNPRWQLNISWSWYNECLPAPEHAFPSGTVCTCN